MANAYFPMLPKVKGDVSKILSDVAGVWKETDINFLRALADSLDCGESIADMGSVDSIPDMWARPLLFKMALFDAEPTKEFVRGLHEKVCGQWRALLAMLALKEIKRLDLKAEQINLQDGSDLGKILMALAPRESLTGKADAWLTDLFIISLDGLPIALTSPTTLVTCAADYETTFAGRLRAPWSVNQSELTDPIKFLSAMELSALKVWLGNLSDKIRRLEKIGDRAKEISNALLKCLADYERDIPAPTGTFEFVPSNLNLHAPIARLLDDTLKGREPRLEDSAVRLMTPRKNLLLVAPDVVRDFARAESVDGSRLVVWQGISAIDITADLLTDRGKIGRTSLHGVQWRRPEDFFHQRMAVVEPANAFPNAMTLRGVDTLTERDLTPIPPIKRELLELFDPEEISARLSISDDAENFYVHFVFPLSGVDNAGKDFRWTKTYPKRDLIYIDRELPVAEIFPDFRREGWTTYFMFYENSRADDDLSPAADTIYLAPFDHEKIFANRRTVKLDAFPDVLTVTYNPPPHLGKAPFDVGFLLMNRPRRVEANADLRWKIGVDFGTSSTMIFVAVNDEPPRPLNFAPHLLQITASGGARAQTYRHFIPSQIPPRADGSFLSIFHLLNVAPSSQIRPLIDGHVFLLSSENTRVFEQFAAQIDANLKWADSDRQRRKTAAYIEQICLQAAAEAAFNGAGDVRWNFSYPTAFSQVQKISFRSLCREAVGNAQATFMTESEAAAYHFNKIDGKAGNFALGAIIVDIGAGTTDISVISGEVPRIVYHTSIRFAAREMFRPIYDNYELFAGEKISTDIRDDIRRQAVIDADLRAHSSGYLADLKFKTGRSDIKRTLQTVQFATAGLFHYLGTLVKVLHDYGHYRGEKIPLVFIGGNGSRIFQWLAGGADIADNVYVNALEKIFVAASGLSGYKNFNLHISPQPKTEVASGMIVESPANDDFFDADRINREMFGAADEIIYAAQLAGADFTSGGEAQSAAAFISAHDIAEGITIDTAHEFQTFVDRFNAASKLWADGVAFDIDELIRDANNFFSDKRGRDVRTLMVEPVFIAELKLTLPHLTTASAPKKISAAEKISRDDEIIGTGFVNDFNALEKLSGFSSRRARENFLRRHKVRAFTCNNVEERMNRPNLAPKFVETSAAGGDFWACAVAENIFAVVPNVRTYTENHHAERALGVVFESNFSGGTYSRLRVERPAVFEFMGGEFRLKHAGKIVLGR